MLLAGHALGKIIALAFRNSEKGFFHLLLTGNIMLCFIFVSFFILFGVFTYYAHEFFVSFFILLISLMIFEIYFVLKVIKHQLIVLKQQNIQFSKYFVKVLDINYSWIPSVCILVIVSVLLVFHAIIIYYHPIFNEYDSLYVFLPISKSIILGNGLNNDFFGGSDISIRYPPFLQAINAWIIDLFDYPTLRLFPIYFIVLASLSIYFITKRLSNNTFLSLTSVAIALITPAFLVISSRFSLQQDLPFLAFLIFSALIFFKIVTSDKIKRFDFLLFIISISLLPLTREIGLIVSWFLFFILLYFRFSKDNTMVRFFLSIISLAPLYALTIIDINNVGFTPIITIRLLTLVSGNAIIIAIKKTVLRSENIRQLRNYLPLLFLFLIPLSFISTNLLLMKGPYPTIMFSSDFSNSLSEYRYIFDIENKLFQTFQESIHQIPRIDLLFFSTALGSLFIIFKFTGFLNLIKKIYQRENQYIFLATFLIILLIVWTYLLGSNYLEAGVRHIGYFIPFISIAIIMALNGNSILNKLYIFAMVIFVLYYYLQFDLRINNQGDHFYAIWIDPFISPYINHIGLIIGLALFSGYCITNYLGKSLLEKIEKSNKRNYLYFIFPLITCLFFYILISTNIQIASLEKTNFTFSGPWENNVFDVVNYLNIAEEGSVLSVRTPAIAYFTNRTNFDVYNPHIFSKVILPILKSHNVSEMDNKLNNLNIKYIVLPNEFNPAGKIVENINNQYQFEEKLKLNSNISAVPLDNYTIYKMISENSFGYDLLNKTFDWQEYNLDLIRFDPTLLILSEPLSEEIEYNRIYLDTYLSSTKNPLLMYLNYTSEIIEGRASFVFEIRDSSDGEILYTQYLKHTFGLNKDGFYILPDSVVNKKIEMRFYIISHDAGKYYLRLDQVSLTKP